MRAEVPARLDRLRLMMFHHMRRVRMETSVSWTNEELVRHTTRITSLGIFCMDSEEMFHLNENGSQFTVAISQRLTPTSWMKRVFPKGHGEVHSACGGATYHLPWIGGVICQHTKITDHGVELIQTSPWFSGSVLLVRKKSKND